MPEIPKELWLLWYPTGGPDDKGCWIVSIDDAPGGETLLACTSEAEARKAAQYQDDMYECEGCYPVRVI